MKKAGVWVSLLIGLLASPHVYAEDIDNLTSEERQFLEYMRQGGASEEEIQELMHMIEVKRGENKQWSEEELEELDRLLTSKWEAMRKALESGDIDTALSYMSRDKRESRRAALAKETRDNLIKLSKELADIRMIRVEGSHYAEYDIRVVRDGKTYSHMLVFEKNSDGVWEIKSF